MKTLKSKISFVYLSLVVLIAAVGTTAVVNLFSLSKAIDNLLSANYKSIQAAANMAEAIERQDSAVLIYSSIDPTSGKNQFIENNDEFLKWFNICASNITETGEKGLIEQIKTSHDKYISLFMKLQEIAISSGKQPALDFYNKEMLPDFDEIKTSLKQLSLLNEKAMFNSKYSATENSRKSTYLVLGLSITAMIGGYFLSRYSTNKFLSPIASLIQTMKLVKAGDLNQQTDIDTKDEIGQLAMEFNKMTKRLLQYEQSALGKLFEEKNKSLAIVKNISDPLVVLDTDYRIVLLNDAFERVFNVREETLINRHFLEGVRNGEIFDFISSSLSLNEETRHKIFPVQSDNQNYYFNVIITTVKGNDSGLSGIIAVFQNVTQLKELEKIRTDFIATISHEFKTPLTSIMMGTGILMDEGLGNLNSEQKHFIKAIQEDSDRLTNLVTDLLELTRIESGRAAYKFQEYAVDDIIECAVKPFYQLAELNEVNIYFQCDEDMRPVIADFQKITYVLNNLISNALKYTNAGDEISVSAKEKDDKVFVTVKDTGVGIPEEYLSRIFDKFVQVNDGDFEVRGTGLGLAVVKEIIDAHQGQIGCESRLDVGSSFTFTLRAAERKDRYEEKGFGD